MNELSYSQKKYLFAIYKLCQSGGEAKSSEAAKAANSIYTNCIIIKEFLENTLGLIKSERL